jgi:Cu-Zn family superoxide dismutase
MNERATTTRSTRRTTIIAAGAATIFGIAALVATGGSATGGGWEGTADLHDASGAKVGKVKFEGDRDGTTVKVDVSGIAVRPNEFHGLHLHDNNNGSGAPCDPAVGFTNVGGHWNPAGVVHGLHLGDLPSLLIQADGTGSARSVTGRFQPGDIAGRAVILHAGPDNFANIPSDYVSGNPPVAGPNTATKGTGDAGARTACGIVELR